MKRLWSIASAVCGGVGALVAAFLLMGQVPSTQPPYNADTGALITLTTAQYALAGNQTTTSASQNNLDKVGVVCTYNQTASSGSASTVFSIEAFDAASGLWNSLVSSASINGPAATTPYTIWVEPGLIAADVPTNGVGKSTHLPRLWRAKTVTTSPNSAAATVGCNLFR